MRIQSFPGLLDISTTQLNYCSWGSRQPMIRWMPRSFLPKTAGRCPATISDNVGRAQPWMIANNVQIASCIVMRVARNQSIGKSLSKREFPTLAHLIPDKETPRTTRTNQSGPRISKTSKTLLHPGCLCRVVSETLAQRITFCRDVLVPRSCTLG